MTILSSLQGHQVYWVKLLVQLQAATQKCWKIQKFNMQRTIFQEDGARILEMVLKEIICTGICSEFKRYNSKSISYILHMAVASFRKTSRLTKCLCCPTQGLSQDKGCAQTRKIHGQVGTSGGHPSFGSDCTNYLGIFARKIYAQAPTNRFYLNLSGMGLKYCFVCLLLFYSCHNR